MRPASVESALREPGVELREARLLLSEAARMPVASLIAHPEKLLDASVRARFRELLARRARGEPVAYLLGRKEFYGLELEVSSAVLIPRPETELLVDLALEQPFHRVVDLGTGSGALALALKRARPGARVVAVDASHRALAVAQANAARHGLDVRFLHGDWFQPLPGERFDLVVANPPYVAEGDPHLDSLAFEPREALVAGPDGLDAIRQLVRLAPRHLLSGGRLLVEHGIGQGAAVRQIFEHCGLEEIETRKDLLGIPRVTGGKVK